MKNLSSEQKSQVVAFFIGMFVGMMSCCVMLSALIGFTNRISPTPTHLSYSTPTVVKPSITPYPTQTKTRLPTPTIIYTVTNTVVLSTFTIVADTATTVPQIIPTQPSHPYGTSGLCADGTYTESKHRQGACSHHGGIAEWWGN